MPGMVVLLQGSKAFVHGAFSQASHAITCCKTSLGLDFGDSEQDRVQVAWHCDTETQTMRLAITLSVAII